MGNLEKTTAGLIIKESNGGNRIEGRIGKMEEIAREMRELPPGSTMSWLKIHEGKGI